MVKVKETPAPYLSETRSMLGRSFALYGKVEISRSMLGRSFALYGKEEIPRSMLGRSFALYVREKFRALW